MRFPGLRRLATYVETQREELSAGFISYSLFLHRVRKATRETYEEIDVIEKRKEVIRRYLQQSGLSAEEFLAQLIDAYEQYAPSTETEALVQQCIVAKLKSIQKGAIVQ